MKRYKINKVKDILKEGMIVETNGDSFKSRKSIIKGEVYFGEHNRDRAFYVLNNKYDGSGDVPDNKKDRYLYSWYIEFDNEEAYIIIKEGLINPKQLLLNKLKI